MQQWLAFPWLRYILWLLSGVLLAIALPYDDHYWHGFVLVAAAAFLLAVLLMKKNKPAQQFVWGVMGFLLLASFGYMRTGASLQLKHAGEQQKGYWWVQPSHEVLKTAKGLRFRALVTAGNGQQQTIEAFVYLPLAALDFRPEPGQLLLVEASLQRVRDPLNPFEFNYKAYLASQGIHYQLFASAAVQAQVPEHTGLMLKRCSFQAKAFLLQLIDRFVQHAEAVAVVKAMVLGERSGLDRDLRQAYADAGVMHVLAVSGLHVGMVYLIVAFLFPYFQKKTWQRIGWLLLVLLVLWAYAWLTGMAPSTMRATVMFSMIAVGKAMRRSGNIYNSIAFSAFILLAWDPLLIRQIGFQLSYLAVIGIVYLQPRISAWYQPEQGWKKKLWEMFSVTLAAQLATFPLGLYYFQQFPTYFFIGNMLAVPLAFGIVYTTLFLLVFHWLPVLNWLLGSLLNWLAVGLNLWVQFTEQLPSSRLIASISTVDVLLLYAAIMALLLFLRLRSRGWGVVSFCLILLLGLSGLWRTRQLREQRSLTVYQIPGHTLLHFLWGRQDVLLSVGEQPGVQQLQYHVEPARIKAGLQPISENSAVLPADFPVPRQNIGNVQLLVWNNMRIAVVEGGQELYLPTREIPVDVLLLRKNPRISLQKLAAAYPAELLLLDASNSHWYREKFKIKANSLHLPFHITAENGAYHHQL